ncbi:MAG TPA: hypothetical protein VJ890_29550 [Vineibacter sp.]|nr:hypothetical protein [Vineibacter sp.]
MQVIGRFGPEVGKLLEELGVTSTALQTLAQELDAATGDAAPLKNLADAFAGAKPGTATAMLGPNNPPKLALKLAFAAVLHDAIGKALKSQAFNVETAINDLWIRLDSVRGLQKPSIDVETMKLKRLIDKRSQMFDMLKGIMEKYDATAKGVIQGIGR